MIPFEITRRFPTEASCIAYFRELKENKGLICPTCKGTAFYWREKYISHDCKKCHYRITLRSGTVMESSKLPFHYWLYGMFMMTFPTKSFSAKDIQFHLRHKRYEPIWAMLHKIRAAMGVHDSKYRLEGVVEVREICFNTQKPNQSATETRCASNKHTAKNLISRQAKAQRSGSGRIASKPQCMVRVMTSIGQGSKNAKSGQNDTTLHKVRMFVTQEEERQRHKSKTEPAVLITTSGRLAFNAMKTISLQLPGTENNHIPGNKSVPWTRIMTWNAKRNINGIHHNVLSSYLQRYLDEFTFKINRKALKAEWFEHLASLSIENTWYDKQKYKSG